MRRIVIGLVAVMGACAISTSQTADSGGATGGDAQVDASSVDVAPDVDTTHGILCGQPGRSCKSPDDCCSGECTGGKFAKDSYCYDPPIQCMADGQACLINDECCSAQCTNGKCAPGCAENGMDCSSTACCQAGTCSNNVCQFGIMGCGPLGAACGPFGCCSGACSNGVCAAATCAGRGSACSAPTDCCTGTCTNGACTTGPTCVWTGACAANFECCTGTCTAGKCEPPMGNTSCRFLEKHHNTDFAECFDCITTSCCDPEANAPIDWLACFQDCMSSLSTWDAYGTCVSSCKSKVGPPPDALSACVTNSCGTSCTQ